MQRPLWIQVVAPYWACRVSLDVGSVTPLAERGPKAFPSRLSCSTHRLWPVFRGPARGQGHSRRSAGALSYSHSWDHSVNRVWSHSSSKESNIKNILYELNSLARS